MTKANRKIAIVNTATVLAGVERAGRLQGSATKEGATLLIEASKAQPLYSRKKKDGVFVSVATDWYKQVRDSYFTGFMLSALFVGDNRPEAELRKLAIAARNAKDADGKGDLKTGERRRTQPEQAAYNAAKMSFSRAVKAAGLEPVRKAPKKKATNSTPPASTTETEKGKVVSLPLAKAQVMLPPAPAKGRDEYVAYVQRRIAQMLVEAEQVNQSAHKRKAPGLPPQFMTWLEEQVTVVKTWMV